MLLWIALAVAEPPPELPAGCLEAQASLKTVEEALADATATLLSASELLVALNAELDALGGKAEVRVDCCSANAPKPLSIKIGEAAAAYSAAEEAQGLLEANLKWTADEEAFCCGEGCPEGPPKRPEYAPERL